MPDETAVRRLAASADVATCRDQERAAQTALAGDLRSHAHNGRKTRCCFDAEAIQPRTQRLRAEPERVTRSAVASWCGSGCVAAGHLDQAGARPSSERHRARAVGGRCSEAKRSLRFSHGRRNRGRALVESQRIRIRQLQRHIGHRLRGRATWQQRGCYRAI
jgi:hypothetical protein